MLGSPPSSSLPSPPLSGLAAVRATHSPYLTRPPLKVVRPEGTPPHNRIGKYPLVSYASLPFGLRSAPKLFNAIADALEWIARHLGVEFLWHYLDDFITIGRPESEECHLHLQALCEVCRRLGVPLASEKVEGPSTCLSFLGIVIDSVALELRLPDDKLRRIRSLLTEWGSRRRCTKQELQSLAGQLQHAASIVRPGRSFLRRLFDLLSTVSKQHHHLRLSQGIRSDLAWWSTFMDQWNGVSFMSLFSPAPLLRQTHQVAGVQERYGRVGGFNWPGRTRVRSTPT